MIIGSDVLMPWPISGFFAMIVTTLSGVILMKAFGTKRLPGSLRDDSRNRIEVRGDKHAATGQRRHAQERPSIELECRILCHRDSWGFGLGEVQGSAATL